MTNKALARIFSCYIGCNFRYDGSVGIIREVAGVNRRMNIEEEAPTGDPYRVDRCKLILKPLSELSYNADLCVKIREILDIREMFTNFMSDRVRFGYNALNTKDVLYLEMPFPVIDELRRCGYDCGFGDIPSLIDAGIAITAQNEMALDKQNPSIFTKTKKFKFATSDVDITISNEVDFPDYWWEKTFSEVMGGQQVFTARTPHPERNVAPEQDIDTENKEYTYSIVYSKNRKDLINREEWVHATSEDKTYEVAAMLNTDLSAEDIPLGCWIGVGMSPSFKDLFDLRKRYLQHQGTER